MSDYRQLKMRRDMSLPLPVIAPDKDFAVHTADANSAGAWEWIISASFGHEYSYSMITDDQRCAPERVFFVKEHAQDIATVTLQVAPEKTSIHMVGTHPWASGRGAVKYAMEAALKCANDMGIKEVHLTTDDFRLPAIRVYLDFGFEPVEDDDEMVQRWAAVREKLAAYVKPERKKINLWPDGNIPLYQEGNDIPAITPYPVEGSRGAVVVCPGGGYCGRASHEGAHIAKMINAAGVSAFVLDYRVNPCHYEAPLTDAKRAIRTVRSMGYEKVAILGFSAGGHLCCSAATLYDLGNPDAEDPIERLSSRPDAFIPCYPVASFVSFRHQGSVENLLGEYKTNYPMLRRFSAELQVTPDTPPAFIWHTATDAGVPVENSIQLAAALSKAGVPFELHIFPEGPHGLGLAGGRPGAGEWPALCQKWLTRLGFAKE